jgi:hypothetical protein
MVEVGLLLVEAENRLSQQMNVMQEAVQRVHKQ